MHNTIEIPQPADGGSLHPLVGRCVSVRNHCERSGLYCASDSESGEVPSAGHYLDGVIVQVTDKHLQSCSVRVGYPARYFGGMPRYGTVAMRSLRSPNSVVSANSVCSLTPDTARKDKFGP